MGIPVIERELARSELDPGIRGNFRDASSYRIRFPAGTTLFKLTSEKAVGRDGRPVRGATGRVSPWWFSYETLEARGCGETYVLPGIADQFERASRLPVTFATFLRARGAVAYDWNRMTHLLVVGIEREAVGVAGECSRQAAVDDPSRRPAHLENVSFIGGAKQLYLPVLQPMDLTVNVYGLI